MAERSGQNYDNHVMFPKALFMAALPILVGVVLAVVGLFKVGTVAGTCLIGTGVALNGLATIFGLGVARGYATKVQDRIIRTEMHLRLQQILPDDLRAGARKLSMGQLIGLRFASDEEMPALVRKVLDENIEDRKAIKQAVKNWQGDYDRV
jgi:ABC-type lipoprotein release transport system permease subunit